MNVTTLNTATCPAMQDEASVDLAQVLRTYMPREDLRVLVRERVKQALAQHVRNAAGSEMPDTPDTPYALDSEAFSQDGIAYLSNAQAIALPSELCTLMARVGFDKSLFTYGQSDGRPAGFAEGCWLLKFVGMADEANATRCEPAFQRRGHRLVRQAG